MHALEGRLLCGLYGDGVFWDCARFSKESFKINCSRHVLIRVSFNRYTVPPLRLL